MAPIPQDRLVRKEVALGVVREFEPPQDHLGLRLLAPFQNVESDDVIFDYTRGLTAGLAPARAEDAESEMAGKDDSVGTGRASLIDWALKDHYDPSDVTRYREGLAWGEIAGAQSFPLTVRNMTEEFRSKIARDTLRRRRMLDNRFEWMIMTALQTGAITYNDGRIIFSVDFGRPANQTDEAPASGILWDDASGDQDPIGDLMSAKAYMYDLYGVNCSRAIASRKIMRTLRSSNKFQNQLIGSNPLYTVTGWGDDAAKDVIERQAEIAFIVYDSVYRTKALGSNTIVNTRFLADNRVYLIPDQNDINALDDMVGFAKTLTAPHPEGNWTPGFYEWERSTVDPWGYDVGTGCKAFPVFPHLDKTYTIQVLA